MIPERADLRVILPEALEKKLPGALLELVESCGELFLRVEPARLEEVCRYLSEEPKWKFDFLATVTVVDWMGRSPRFDVVYNLRALSHNHRLGIKVAVPDGTLTVPSLTGLWKAADWLEREAYDLYGINFAGHPNLRRIMMSDDWEGHPYRKDYPLEGRD